MKSNLTLELSHAEGVGLQDGEHERPQLRDIAALVHGRQRLAIRIQQPILIRDGNGDAEKALDLIVAARGRQRHRQRDRQHWQGQRWARQRRNATGPAGLLATRDEHRRKSNESLSILPTGGDYKAWYRRRVG